MKKILFALALMTSAAQASGIGIHETRMWQVCKDESVALSLAELYFSDGEEAFRAAVTAAANKDLCWAHLGTMMPQAVVYRQRSQSVTGTVDLRVVRVAAEDDKELFWLTPEAVVGEPVLH